MPRIVIQGNPMDPDPFEIVIRDEHCPHFPDTYLIVVKSDDFHATETTTRSFSPDRRMTMHPARLSDFLVDLPPRRENSAADDETNSCGDTKSPVECATQRMVPRSVSDLRSATRPRRRDRAGVFTLRHPQNDRVTPKRIDQGVRIMPKRPASGSAAAHTRGAAIRFIGGVFMCGEQIGGETTHRFDPTRCPLLQGLTAEEADRMMRTDPRIRACMAASESGAAHPEPCVAGMVRAHDARAVRVA